MWTIPNLLTIFRILCIPIILILCTYKLYGIALGISIISSISDFFDGFLARKLNQTSYLGALLDPIADKAFEMVLFLYFYIEFSNFQNYLFLGYLVLMYLRNSSQLSVFPVLMWWKKIEFKVEPKMPAKIASALGMVLANIIILSFIIQNLETSINHYFQILIKLGLGFGILLETYMLVTFLPRYRKVYLKKHDTFN